PASSIAAAKPMIMRERVVIIASSIVLGCVSSVHVSWVHVSWVTYSALQHRGVEAGNRERANSLSWQVYKKQEGESGRPKGSGSFGSCKPKEGPEAGGVRAFSFCCQFRLIVASL